MLQYLVCKYMDNVAFSAYILISFLLKYLLFQVALA
jgi:hypothetical protein